jgi:hypothetical protein
MDGELQQNSQEDKNCSGLFVQNMNIQVDQGVFPHRLQNCGKLQLPHISSKGSRIGAVRLLKRQLVRYWHFCNKK